MSLNYKEHNKAVQDWGAKGRQQFIAVGRGMGITHQSKSTSKVESLSKIKDRYGYDSTGYVNKVSFGNISRSLIYTTLGAGKGRAGRKGSRWIDKYGNRKTTNPKSMGKMGMNGRSAKPFIGNVLDGAEGVEQLADIVAIHQGDAIVGKILIK